MFWMRYLPAPTREMLKSVISLFAKYYLSLKLYLFLL